MLVRCSVVFTLLLSLYVAIDYTEVAGQIDSPSLLSAYWFKLPEVVSHLLPLALTTGILLTVTHAKRSGEWVAAQMAGISTVCIFIALMLLPTVLLPLTHLNCHVFAPQAVAKFEQTLHYDSRQPMNQFSMNEWIVSNGNDDTRISVQRTRIGRAKQLIVTESHNGAVSQRWQSPQMSPEGGGGEVFIWPPQLQTLMVPRAGVNGIVAASIPSGELNDFAKDVALRGGEASALESTVALRHGTVMALWFVPFLALSLLVSMETFTSSIFAVFLSVAVAVVYWAMMAFTWGLVSAAHWPTTFIPLLGVGAFLSVGALVLKAIRH